MDAGSTQSKSEGRASLKKRKAEGSYNGGGALPYQSIIGEN